MNDKVVVVGLLGGQELIGTVVGDVEKLELTDILVLGYKVDEKGALQFGFGAYSPLTKPEKALEKNLVLWVSEPIDEILQSYNTTLGKLVTPPTQLVIP